MEIHLNTTKQKNQLKINQNHSGYKQCFVSTNGRIDDERREKEFTLMGYVLIRVQQRQQHISDWFVCFSGSNRFGARFFCCLVVCIKRYMCVYTTNATHWAFTSLVYIITLKASRDTTECKERKLNDNGNDNDNTPTTITPNQLETTGTYYNDMIVPLRITGCFGMLMCEYHES